MFENMLKNATILNESICKNEFNLDLDKTQFKTKNLFRDYYVNICLLVQECHYLKPTPEEIESLIVVGSFDIGGKTNTSPIKDCDFRKYLFLSAQARQLVYDTLGGRGSMIRGEDGKFDVCRDTIELLKRLGLYQRTFMMM